jgi:predicted nucleic acid-binding protein
MRIVVDSNIAFSAILNSSSRLAQIILQPKSRLNFYSTNQLNEEIQAHKTKIQVLTKYSETELERAISLIINKIRFINIHLIPKEVYLKAEKLTQDVDIDDTEFVALAEHIKAKLWTGDKKLIKGLKAKNWNRIVTTEELFSMLVKN